MAMSVDYLRTQIRSILAEFEEGNTSNFELCKSLCGQLVPALELQYPDLVSDEPEQNEIWEEWLAAGAAADPDYSDPEADLDRVIDELGLILPPGHVVAPARTADPRTNHVVLVGGESPGWPI